MTRTTQRGQAASKTNSIKWSKALERVLEQLNSLSADEAEVQFRKCCGSTAWASNTAAERPFATLSELITKADDIWWSLKPHDWLEAFRCHPKIGEKKAADQISLEAQKWSEQEQAGVGNVTQATTQALTELNQEYEEKFGYICIVCATGKSSAEMLASLRERLKNDPDTELRTAAGEQAKITQLRLKKLIDSFEIA